MKWSSAKQEVFRFESDIIVSAGAGSGKTATLVELYLRLLAGETSLPPLKTDEIVAITFTEKAALEMRERVRDGARKRLAAGDTAADWKGVLQTLGSAVIATFHSFCAAILREYPADAGVDPSFVLLDELAAKTELRQALDELLEEEMAARSPGLRLLLELFPLSGSGRAKGLRDHLADLHASIAGSGRSVEMAEEAEERWQAEAERIFRETLPELAELEREVERILAGKELVFHRQLLRLPGLLQEGRLILDEPETVRRLGAMTACITGTWGKEKPVKDRLTSCLSSLEAAARQRLNRPATLALIDLLRKLERGYGRRKGRKGGLDFEDLQVKTRNLLRDRPAVRDSFRERFRVLMVDEFQDTNPLQKELVDLLCGPDQRLFIVGDPKQSIYLFRGADVTVFGRAREEMADRNGTSLHFRESFRSRPGIVRFVNALFTRVMGGGGSDFAVPYHEDDHLEPQRSDGGETCVELVTIAADGPAEELRAEEAAVIARMIGTVVAGTGEIRICESPAGSPGETGRIPRYGDIAILLRRFSNLKTYEDALRRREIPYYVVKGKGFYRCQEVLDILNFLRCLDSRGDLTPLAGLLRSPLCGVSDETLYLLSRPSDGLGAWESWFGDTAPVPAAVERIDAGDRLRLRRLAELLRRLRPLRDRLTLAELLEEILTGTAYAPTLLATFQGAQKVANLRKLIEISRAFARQGEGSLRRFVNYLAELVENEPTEAEAQISGEDENVVRLMTIHQSKGLEFPVVFVPELGSKPPAVAGAVLFDPDRGLGLRQALPGETAADSLAHAAIADLRKRKEAAERKRLLYVAVTRAKDHLVLLGEGKGEWRAWLDELAAAEGTLLRVRPAAEIPDTQPAGLLPAERPEPPQPGVVARAAARSLRFVPPLPTTTVFSPTALEDYRHCPRKYYFKAVMGLDEGLFAQLLRPAAPVRNVSSQPRLSPLEKGNLAHALLERLDFAAPGNERRAACSRLAPLLAAVPDKEGIAHVLDRVAAFASSPTGQMLAGRTLLREHPFLLSFRSEAVHYLRGAIDLIALSPDDALVLDYKFLAREGADLAGYRFQLGTYLLALGREWPDRRISGRLVFLEDGGEEEVTWDLPAFERELVATMDAIRRRSGEEQFELLAACDGSHCPFRERCGR